MNVNARTPIISVFIFEKLMNINARTPIISVFITSYNSKKRF